MTDSEIPLQLVSPSQASDGSFTAISEIGSLLHGREHRLIGGVAVALHQHQVGISHPVRATADADFGIPPYALRDDSLVTAVSELGYRQVAGNRWSRSIDGTRVATVDLLVPSYRDRLRSSVQHGSTNTTEVGGLAVALKRPALIVAGTVKLTDGTELSLALSIPDAASMLGLKLHARRARDEDRDAVDLWTCMEILVASRQIAEDGRSTRILIRGTSDGEAARRRTRIRGLVRAISRSR